MRKFILRSSDGKSYELEGKAALQSRMIGDMIEDDCPDDVIPVSVPGHILSKVVAYCQKHAEYDLTPVPSPDPSYVLSPLERELRAWDLDFVKLDRRTLCLLTEAANYLNIDSLLNLTCQHLANMIQRDVRNIHPSSERPLKSSLQSSTRVLHAGRANSVPVAKIKDTGARRFFVVCYWEGDRWNFGRKASNEGIFALDGCYKLLCPLQFESTYKVKKIVDSLNNSQVPPPDVVEVVVCPAPFSESVVQSSLREDFQLATEIRGSNYDKTCSWELHAEMVVEEGIPWVILGHSNSRYLDHDSDEVVGDKVAYVYRHGLKVIACVGETIRQREDCRTMDVIAAQTKAIAERVPNWENIVLAYNPLGPVATSSQAQEVHACLRRWLHENVSPEVASKTRIIYGGSVGDADWKELALKPDIDGFLVGGPPLKEFTDIIKLAEKVD